MLGCLGKAGTQVVVPYREQDEARHLRVCGDLGQIVPMVSDSCRLVQHSWGCIGADAVLLGVQEWDLMNDTQIEECLRHSDTVYNLVGRNYKTKYARLILQRVQF
jgi:NADH dehydrogenase (ubiquinone) 1 alpha subcomplex subunit 9